MLWLAVVRLAVDGPAGTAGTAGTVQQSDDQMGPVVILLLIGAAVLFLVRRANQVSRRTTPTRKNMVFVPPDHMMDMGEDAVTWVRSVRAEVVAIAEANDHQVATLEDTRQRLIRLQRRLGSDGAKALADIEQRLGRAGAGAEKLSSRLDRVAGDLGTEVPRGRRRAK